MLAMLTLAHALATPAFAALYPDVVELSGGKRLLGQLKGTGEVRQILTPAGLQSLPEQEIVFVQERADLLQRLRARQAAFGSDTRTLVTLAGWSLEHGLYDAALDLLDQCLRRGADVQAQALLVASRDALLLDGLTPDGAWSEPELRRLVLLAVTPRQPARAQVAGAWLERRADQHARLAPLLRSTRVEVRRLASGLVAQAAGPATQAALVRASLEDRDEQVRRQALAGALQLPAQEIRGNYLQALASARPESRDSAMTAVGTLAEPRAVPVLIRLLAPHLAAAGEGPPRNYIHVGRQITYVPDFDVEIAQGAVIADPQVGVLQDGQTLEVRVTASSSLPRAERARVIGLLSDLTGQELGDDFGAWARWWNQNGRTYLTERLAATAGQ